MMNAGCFWCDRDRTRRARGCPRPDSQRQRINQTGVHGFAHPSELSGIAFQLSISCRAKSLSLSHKKLPHSKKSTKGRRARLHQAPLVPVSSSISPNDGAALLLHSHAATLDLVVLPCAGGLEHRADVDWRIHVGCASGKPWDPCAELCVCTRCAGGAGCGEHLLRSRGHVRGFWRPGSEHQ